eukprot:Amastigsp_a845114_107.p1 type:complete len:155 gc:universal Amastigsp_a845114_107:686-222(-)
MLNATEHTTTQPKRSGKVKNKATQSGQRHETLPAQSTESSLRNASKIQNTAIAERAHTRRPDPTKTRDSSAGRSRSAHMPARATTRTGNLHRTSSLRLETQLLKHARENASWRCALQVVGATIHRGRLEGACSVLCSRTFRISSLGTSGSIHGG